MAALFDAASGNSAENVTSLSWTHTPVGTPTGVSVKVGWWTSADVIASITYGGVSMGAAKVSAESSVPETASIYGLASPPAGPQTVLITWSQPVYATGIAVTVTGGHSSTICDPGNVASATGSDAAPTVACPSAVGELAIDFTVCDESGSPNVPTYTPGAGQTQRGYQQTGGLGAQASTEAGAAGTVTMSQTASAAGPWAHVAMSFKAADASVMALDTGYFALTGSDISFTLSDPTAVRNVPCYALLIQNADLTGPAYHYVTARPTSGGIVPSGSFAHIGQAYATTVLADAPSGYWRLGESDGTVAIDSSRNGLHGVYQNAPTLSVDGAIKQDADTAVTLNGTNEYISVPDNALLDPGDTFTLEAWVRTTTFAVDTQVIFAKGVNGYGLEIEYLTGTLILKKTGVATIIASSSPVATNEWCHVVCTKSGATTKLYINGADVSTAAVDQTIVATAFSLGIGAIGGSAPFNGSLDEVAIYPTALSAARVLAHYQAGIRGITHDVLIPEGIDRAADPRESRFDTSTLTFTLRDPGGVVTAVVSNFPGKQAILYTWDYTESFSLAEFMFVGIVQDFAYSDAGYRITARSPIVLADTMLFNGGRTELLAGIGSTDLSMTVADASGFADTGVLLVESERIAYTIRVDNGSSWTLSGLSRGHLSSASVPHVAGVAVVENFVIGPAHPYEIVRTLFTNPADGRVGLGMPTYIDDAQIAAQITAVGSTFEMFFEVTEPANAKAWIEEKILKVMGALPFENNLGHTCIKSFSAASSTVDSIADAHCLQRAEWKGNFPRRVNSVTYLYDKDAVTGDHLSSYPVTDDGLIARDGLLPIVIEADGIHSSLSSAVALMEARGRAYIEKFGLQLPTMSARTVFAKRFLESADDVAVTFERMANLSTGVVGVTSGPAEIIASRINFQDNTVEFELLEHGPIFDVFADEPVMTADTSSFTESIGTAVNPYTMVLDTAYYTLTGNAVNLNYSESSPTYYVALYGSDSTGTGTEGNPWRTVKHGVAQLAPGDTLLIHVGLYTESISVPNGDTIPSGSSGNVITIQAYPGETVTIAPTGGTSQVILQLSGVSYTTWADITLDGASMAASSLSVCLVIQNASNHNTFENVEVKNAPGYAGITIANGSSFTELLNCNVHDNGAFAQTAGFYGHAVYISYSGANSTDTLIDGGRYYNNSGMGITQYAGEAANMARTTVRNARIYHNGYNGATPTTVISCVGLHLTDGDDLLAYNNLIYNNGAAGISISNGTADGVGLYNNTLFNNSNDPAVGGGYGYAAIVLAGSPTNVTIQNNIAYGNYSDSIDSAGAGAGYTASDNLFTNPLFTAVGSGDFTTLAGSDARNAGTSLAGIFTTDFAGTARPQGAAWDIGAYEAA